MANYYCLLSGLPFLKPEGVAEGEMVSSAWVRNLIEEEYGVSDRDKKLISLIYLKGDCRNLLLLLENSSAELPHSGNWTKEELQEMVADALEDIFQDDPRFPGFMAQFVREYVANRKEPNYFAEDRLMLRYWNYMQQEGTGFVKKWAELNINVSNILTAFICRQQQWDVERYIYGDNDVTESIRRNPTASDFGLTREVDYMPSLQKIVECTDPVEKERHIDALKWTWIEDETFLSNFDIDALFAYLLKVEMLERWQLLDPDFGRETFENIIEDLRSECQVPQEFTTYMKSEGSYSK